MSALPAQVTITLPDGKTMTFARGVTGAELHVCRRGELLHVQQDILDQFG